MEIEQVAEMARAVATLPQAERDYFEGMVADERAKAAEANRIADLRVMSDEDAIQLAVDAGVDVKWKSYRPGEARVVVDLRKVEAALREAGFVRLTDSDEGAVELACRLMRNSPRVRMLMRFEARQAMYGELTKGVPAPTWSTCT